MRLFQLRHRRAGLMIAALLAFTTGLLHPVLLAAPAATAVLDDCSDATRTSTGSARLLIDDHAMGSQSHGTLSCDQGVLTVQGSLVPGRGLPAFLSLVLLISPDGQPHDVSAFQGVRLRVKVKQGAISVQVGSSAIDNYDFHSSPVRAGGGEFQEVRVPFKDMKRAWSEQIPLDRGTVTSINIVAFGMAPGDFSYALDEVGFY